MATKSDQSVNSEKPISDLIKQLIFRLIVSLQCQTVTQIGSKKTKGQQKVVICRPNTKLFSSLTVRVCLYIDGDTEYAYASLQDAHQIFQPNSETFQLDSINIYQSVLPPTGCPGIVFWFPFVTISLTIASRPTREYIGGWPHIGCQKGHSALSAKTTNSTSLTDGHSSNCVLSKISLWNDGSVRHTPIALDTNGDLFRMLPSGVLQWTPLNEFEVFLFSGQGRFKTKSHSREWAHPVVKKTSVLLWDYSKDEYCHTTTINKHT